MQKRVVPLMFDSSACVKKVCGGHDSVMRALPGSAQCAAIRKAEQDSRTAEDGTNCQESMITKCMRNIGVYFF